MQAQLRDAVARAAKGQAVRYDVNIRIAGGGLATIDFQIAPLRNEAGEITHLIPSAVDISSRKAVEAELAAQQALLLGISSATPGLIYAKDRESRLLYANPFCVEIIGQPLEAILGRSDVEWTQDKARAELIIANDRAVMEKGTAQTFEEVFVSPDGQARFFASTKAPLRNADGEVVGIVGVATDVSELERAKAALAKAVESRELLLFEVNHRVKNSLQLVTSLLLLEASKIADPQAKAAVLGARQKVFAIAQLHRRLYSDGQHSVVDFGAYARDAVAETKVSAGDGVRLDISVEGHPAHCRSNGPRRWRSSSPSL